MKTLQDFGAWISSMGDLGEFGFWLAVAAIIVVWSLTSALKDREAERQKQETLRQLLDIEAQGKLTPGTLAYDTMQRMRQEEGLGLPESLVSIDESVRTATPAELAASGAFVAALIGGLLALPVAWMITGAGLVGVWW